MLEKLIIIYFVITTLNPANKLCIRAAINLNGLNAKGLKTIGAALDSSDSIETWQPIIQTRKWLAPLSTANISSPSPSTPLMSTSTPSLKSSSSRIKLTQKHKQQQYLKPYQQTTDYIPYNHRSGNNSKLNITTSPLSAAAASATVAASATTTAYANIKFKPSYLLMLNTNKQLRHNPTHQHYLAKHTENVYPQIPKDIVSQVQQPYTYMNTAVTSKFPHNLHNRKADVNLHVQQPKPQQYANIITPILNAPTSPTGIISSKDFNSIESEHNLIDLNFTNESAKNSQRAEEYGDGMANDVVNLNEKLTLIQKTFDNIREFYDNVKDIILSDKDNADDTYSNEDADEIDDYDHDLTKVNSVFGSDAAATAAAASAATAEKLSSLNMKKTIPLSSTLVGEVQGHKRQIDKGTAMKYSLISQQSETQQNVLAPAEITARGRLMWNMSKAKSTLASSARPSSSSSASSSTSSSTSLSTFGTGRKIKKKLKKKFQKFLLPLVLAYKLKFLTLIPLLIGGLTLLVGTTGLAGFFFALFTAVMSLKSGAKSAIVVKKY